MLGNQRRLVGDIDDDGTHAGGVRIHLNNGNRGSNAGDRDGDRDRDWDRDGGRDTRREYNDDNYPDYGDGTGMRFDQQQQDRRDESLWEDTRGVDDADGSDKDSFEEQWSGRPVQSARGYAGDRGAKRGGAPVVDDDDEEEEDQEQITVNEDALPADNDVKNYNNNGNGNGNGNYTEPLRPAKQTSEGQEAARQEAAAARRRRREELERRVATNDWSPANSPQQSSQRVSPSKSQQQQRELTPAELLVEKDRREQADIDRRRRREDERLNEATRMVESGLAPDLVTGPQVVEAFCGFKFQP